MTIIITAGKIPVKERTERAWVWGLPSPVRAPLPTSPSIFKNKYPKERKAEVRALC